MKRLRRFKRIKIITPLFWRRCFLCDHDVRDEPLWKISIHNRWEPFPEMVRYSCMSCMPTRDKLSPYFPFVEEEETEQEEDKK